MDIVETGFLLAKIQAFDNRNVGDETMAAWQEVLAPHILPDCLDAVADYYRNNAEWIMPSHIVERVRLMEEARTRSFKNGYHLNRVDEENAADWSAAMRELGRAVRTGSLTPAAYEAYADSEKPLEAFLTRKEIGQ